VDVAIQATRSDGSPVQDLKASDLRVFDNGKPQTIVSFETLEPFSTSTPGQVQGKKTPSAARNFPHYSIILLDVLNTGWSDQIYARRAVEHLLDYFPAGEQIAIFVLGDRLYLLHDFTSNAAELRAALQQFSIGQPVGGESSSSGGPFSAQFSWSSVVAASDSFHSRGMGSRQEQLFYQRIRIKQTMQVLKAIAGMLKGLPGQKDLLWVTGGFPLRLHGGHGPMDLETFYDQAQQTTRALSSAALRVYPVDARGLSLEGNVQINIDTMREFAQQTGGRAFYNNNDLTAGMRQALKDARQSYLLTYIPNDFRADGSFHKIRVRVLRPGIKLRYRPGYYAASPSKVADKPKKPAGKTGHKWFPIF
jgi:VWFA-related protein